MRFLYKKYTKLNKKRFFKKYVSKSMKFSFYIQLEQEGFQNVPRQSGTIKNKEKTKWLNNPFKN